MSVLGTIAKTPLYLFVVLRYLIGLILQIVTFNYFCGRLHCTAVTKAFPILFPMPENESLLAGDRATGSAASAGVSVRVPGFQEPQELPAVALPL